MFIASLLQKQKNKRVIWTKGFQTHAVYAQRINRDYAFIKIFLECHSHRMAWQDNQDYDFSSETRLILAAFCTYFSPSEQV